MIKFFNGDLLRSNCQLICHQVSLQGTMGGGVASGSWERIYAIFEELFRESEIELQIWKLEVTNAN